MPATGRTATAAPARHVLAAHVWLGFIALLIFAMVIVGGATRLTESGLSITEWKPLLGAIPPLTDAAWAEAFAKYREIPQFRLVNHTMTLDEFRFIFWWEWSHRFLGRFIGIAFALPLAIFALAHSFTPRLMRRALLLLVLGGTQGAIGWWMVASGLVDRVDVAPYRLATHLTLAALIFSLTISTALNIQVRANRVDLCPPSQECRHSFARVLLGAILAQIFLGGLVAGNDAGLIYNTWPLMGQGLIPGEIWDLQPLWRNLFENHATVQFLHRIGGYGLFALTLAYVWISRPSPPHPSTLRPSTLRLHRLALALFALTSLQGLLGIATLLSYVPLHLALLHQAMGFMVLAIGTALTSVRHDENETVTMSHN